MKKTALHSRCKPIRLREKKRRLRLWAGRALLMLFIAWLLSFVFGIFVVQGDSMRPSYRDGDVLWILRTLPKGVSYGDVVILENPEGKEILKRIVGLPGDQICISADGHLMRNGIPITETDILYGEAYGETPVATANPTLTVEPTTTQTATANPTATTETKPTAAPLPIHRYIPYRTALSFTSVTIAQTPETAEKTAAPR